MTNYLTKVWFPTPWELAHLEGAEYELSISCAGDGRTCGRIVITETRNDACYIAWYLDDQFRGKGYMFDAVAQTLPWLFERTHRVVAMIWPRNERSKQLAERAGFRYEGTARSLHKMDDGSYMDVEFWAVLKEDRHGKDDRTVNQPERLPG